MVTYNSLKVFAFNWLQKVQNFKYTKFYIIKVYLTNKNKILDKSKYLHNNVYIISENKFTSFKSCGGRY